MRVIVVAVGRVKERELRAAIDGYAQRVRRYVAFEEVEIDAALAPDRSARAMQKACAGARVVALFFSEADAALIRDGTIWRATARFRALVEGD